MSIGVSLRIGARLRRHWLLRWRLVLRRVLLSEVGYLVVSGGSTPFQLFSLLSETDIDGQGSRIVADERWVDVRNDGNGERVGRTLLLRNRAAGAEFFFGGRAA